MSDNKPPVSSSPLVWLFGFLTLGSAAIFGVLRVPEQSSSTKTVSTPPKTESNPASSSTVDRFDPLDVLQDYLRVGPKQENETSKVGVTLTRHWGDFDVSLSMNTSLVTSRTEELSELLKAEPARYDFFIVTVPDPVESNFAHEFDANVNSLQRAFEATGGLLRASRLPWRHSKRNPDANVESVRKRGHPGVLLFETTPDPPESTLFTIVCLIAESPISGIDKAAFTIALNARKSLDSVIGDNCEEPRWQNDSTIKVIAPCFSGSQTSLLSALKSWYGQRSKLLDQYRIITGSATALDAQKFELPGIHSDHGLRATVISNVILTNGIFSYLSGCRGPSPEIQPESICERVAILRESNTGFGASQKPKPQNFHTPDDLFAHYIDLPFPMSIHRLQTDANQSSNRTASITLPQTGFVEPKLSNDNRIDAIPPYDPESAASMAGEGLRAIIETIKRAQVRYVGIMATDSRDIVFLNRMVRKECPDVRVFTTEPSIALLHPEDAYHLRGMLVASTYPLDLRSQEWDPVRTNKPIMAFQSGGSQGVYNAVLAHCGCYDQMIGYRPPLLSHACWMSPRPPIWISVVGEGGRLVPVHYFSDYIFSDDFAVKQDVPLVKIPFELCSSNPQSGHATVFVPVAMLLRALLAIVLLGAVLATVIYEKAWKRLAFGLTSTQYTSRVEGGWIWFWRGVILAGIMLFVLPFTLPAWDLCGRFCGAPPKTDSPVPARYQLMGSFSCVLNAMCFALCCSMMVAGWINARKKRLAVGMDESLGYLILAIGVAAAWFSSWVWWMGLQPVERFLLYSRCADLSAGLSPIAPLTLLGLSAVVLGWFCLKQSTLSRILQLECPAATSWTEVANVGRNLTEGFRHPLKTFPSDRWFRTIVIFVSFLLWGGWTCWVNPLPSGEGPVWDWFVRGLFSVFAAMIILTLLRLLTLWGRLVDFLKEILQMPMVTAFERLPSEITRLFADGISSQERTYKSHIKALLWCLPVNERTEFTLMESSDNVPRLTKSEEFSLLVQKANGFLEELQTEWHTKSIDEAFSSDVPKKQEIAVGEIKSDWRSRRKAVIEAKETYVAAYLAIYLIQFFAQLRMLVYSIVIATPLVLFAGACYPFQPNRPQVTALFALLLLVVIGTATILYQMNRNRLISRIMRTTPNRFTPDLSIPDSITTYVLPLVGLIVLHFLGLVRFVVDPIISIFQ